MNDELRGQFGFLSLYFLFELNGKQKKTKNSIHSQLKEMKSIGSLKCAECDNERTSYSWICVYDSNYNYAHNNCINNFVMLISGTYNQNIDNFNSLDKCFQGKLNLRSKVNAVSFSSNHLNHLHWAKLNLDFEQGKMKIGKRYIEFISCTRKYWYSSLFCCFSWYKLSVLH